MLFENHIYTYIMYAEQHLASLLDTYMILIIKIMNDGRMQTSIHQSFITSITADF
jgi:hypothetical protein